MSTKDFDKSQCKGLVSVNPDVTGLGVVSAILGQSLLGVIVLVILVFLKRRKETREQYKLLEKGLLKITDVEATTCIVQMIATLIVIRDLTIDQLLLISYIQACIATQILGCTTITFSHLTPINYIFFYPAQASMNLAAGVWIRKLASRPLERECLAAYLNHNPARWGGPEYQFFLGGALYCLGIVFYFFTDDMYGHTKIMLRVLYVAVTIAGWVILAVFTTNIYAAAANLKENSSDSELKNFGQILALSTIGVLLWELYKSYKEWIEQPENAAQENILREGEP